jgi:Arc/MetJ family transcription regulator
MKDGKLATGVIEEALLDKALQVSGLQTKKETVTKALEDFIRRYHA